MDYLFANSDKKEYFDTLKTEDETARFLMYLVMYHWKNDRIRCMWGPEWDEIYWDGSEWKSVPVDVWNDFKMLIKEAGD